MLKFLLICWVLSLVLKPKKSEDKPKKNNTDKEFEENFFSGASGKDIDDF